jgi:cell wall-associated NlpC family hydrolase
MLGVEVLLAGLLVFLLPGNPSPNRDALAARFVAELEQTVGWRYQGAGENRLGVDCSGLVRHAWRAALWREAWKQRHAGWAREAVHNWWFDAGARAMGEEYQARTLRVMDAPSLAAARTGPLQPGDLAVTLQENHLLAHLGEGRWIQADPSARRVTILEPDLVERAWANIPMRIVRWREVSEAWLRPTREEGKK